MEPIIRLLQQKQIDYDVLEHESPIRTAEEGARYFGIEPGQTAPALILKADDDYLCLIISGDRGRVEMEQLARQLSRKQVKLASPADVQQLTGYKVGSVPVVGLSLPCVLDRWLLRYSHVYGGTGDPLSTLKIDPRDLEKANQVIDWIE